MKNLFLDDEEFGASDVVFRDMISLLLLGFVLMFFILIVFINPGKKQSEEDSTIKSPGSISVFLVWENSKDVDLDLWAKPPDDFPIGYRNRENKSCNLLRDDLGKTNDLFTENFENIYCRDLIPGEYIFNIHFYGLKDNSSFINYKIEVRLVSSGKDKPTLNKILLYKEDKFETSEKGSERTIIRFTINEKGEVDDKSINNEFISLLKASY